MSRLALIIILLNFINLILGLPITTVNIAARWGHSATFVNSRIYFIGGRTAGDVLITEFLSLDVSKPFSSFRQEWTQLNAITMPKTIGHSAVRGGLNSNQIITFGGSVDDPANNAGTNSFWVYDTVSEQLTNPIIQNPPSRIYEHTAVVNPQGKMLIYGGLADQTTGSAKVIASQELWELNTITLDTWNIYPLINNSPGLRRGHTASIIDDKMIILGGMTSDIPLGMNVIYVFDLNTNNWDVKTATGEIPEPRRDHSAVVANKKIVIYGGSDVTRSNLYGDVVVLDTSTWSWATKITTDPPPKRRGHTATLVGANMIIAFGMTEISVDSSIYVLNLLNWSWLTEYVPMDLPIDDGTFTPMNNITNPNKKRPPETNDEIKIYIGAIIGLSIISALLLALVIIYIIYKMVEKRRRERDLIAIPYELNKNPNEDMIQRPPLIRRKTPRPAFLNLGQSNKSNHDSFTQGLLSTNSSIPSTPLTARTSNVSGIGRPKSVRFSNTTIVLRQYFPPDSDDSIEIDVGVETTKGMLGVDDAHPRPSIESVDYTYTIARERSKLQVVNPDPEEDGRGQRQEEEIAVEGEGEGNGDADDEEEEKEGDEKEKRSG